MSKNTKTSAETLWAKAKEARLRAHAPYSKFKVGAALVDDRGEVFVGCNVENSSYGATICAERTAITSMVAAGGQRVSDIVVVTESAQICPPCGLCLQVLLEFSEAGESSRIHLGNAKGIVQSHTLKDLLPKAFDSSFLS